MNKKNIKTTENENMGKTLEISHLQPILYGAVSP
jgi:hypothetical protein